MSTPGVVELRQYTLKPGRREELVDRFERELIDPQVAAGMEVIGYFRDREDPDRFVWLRGFPDMPARKAALEAFYNSDLWFEHRPAVNDTLVDSDDVLLLKPATQLRLGNGARSLVTATVWPFVEPVSADTLRRFTDEVEPELVRAGAEPVALLVTEPSANDFPRLPVREGENVLVWLGRLADEAGYEAETAAVDRSIETFGDDLAESPQKLCLVPAARSRLA